MSAALSQEQWDKLFAAAQRASEKAYAPFSQFHVGAAILTADGRTFSGCNVENSSYGLTNCAERTAIFTAITEGAVDGSRDVRAVAVVNRDGVPCSPCGACRQVIFEFGPDAVVAYRGKDGKIEQKMARELLPEGFRLRDGKSSLDQ